MTNQALPGRPPAHDLTAFDLSKRSPEQVARSFAHWKAQRKRQAEAASTRADPLPSPAPALAGTGDAAPGDRAAAPTRESAKQASPPQYSAPFSDLLAAGSEPTVQRALRPPVAALRPPPRPVSPGRRLKVMSILAGAASVSALAGGALLELTDWRDPIEVVAPQAALAPQAVRQENPAMGSLATAAASLATAEWKLQPIVDVALMRTDAPPPASSTAETPTPAIQTASKAVSVSTSEKPVLPERKGSAPGSSTQFVAKPFVPDQAPAPIPTAQEAAPVPALPVATAGHTGDPRPDALFQHDHANRNGAVSDRAASTGNPAAATGSTNTIDARAIGVRGSTAANRGNSDPRGEASGGARVGIAGEIGAGTPGHASDSESGESDANDAGDGGTNGGGGSGGVSTGTAGADDTGGAATGANGAGGDTGGNNAGSADPGSGDSGTDGAGAADSGDGDSGKNGESGGALGAVGDALGGALGGGKGNPDSNDKDQRN